MVVLAQKTGYVRIQQVGGLLLAPLLDLDGHLFPCEKIKYYLIRSIFGVCYGNQNRLHFCPSGHGLAINFFALMVYFCYVSTVEVHTIQVHIFSIHQGLIL